MGTDFLTTAMTRGIAPYVATNAAAVTTLWLAQAFVVPAGAEFGATAIVSLLPGATLAGYAAGVGLSATMMRDLTSARGLALHLVFLTASVSLAAWAWSPDVLAIACLLTGLGCSLTQRLLASASNRMSQARRAQAISWVIAGGLSGIVLARACAPMAIEAFGRRPLLLADACVIALVGWTCLQGLAWRDERVLRDGVIEPVWSVWRRSVVLRNAALQQAAVFAAYNYGWTHYPSTRGVGGSELALSMGVIAGFGTIAALVSGRLCSRHDPADIARSGVFAILLSAALFELLPASFYGTDACMAMLDMGTQIALVANQARAQAMATSPAMRGRVAAIVTAIGFLGGAVGAAVGNLWG